MPQEQDKWVIHPLIYENTSLVAARKVEKCLDYLEKR